MKRNIKDCTFEKDVNYDEFIDEMEQLFEDFANLKDESTGESLALTEEYNMETIIEKLVESDSAWQEILDSATTAFDQGDNDFTMEDLHMQELPKNWMCRTQQVVTIRIKLPLSKKPRTARR